MTNLLVEGFTSMCKKFFQQKSDHVKDYLNKRETLFIKCKEDGQISPDEFELFQKLLKDFENEAGLMMAKSQRTLKRFKDEQKGDLRATQQDCSEIPTKTQVNLFCCFIVYLLTGESKDNMICERLTPIAPPPYEI